MPTYAYSCTECGHAFDAVQSFTDDALTTCPECGGRLRKVYGSIGVTFKGSGFYRTDSRSSGSNGKPGGDKPSSGSSDAGKKDSSGTSSTGSSSGSTGSSSTSSSSSASSGSSSSSSSSTAS